MSRVLLSPSRSHALRAAFDHDRHRELGVLINSRILVSRVANQRIICRGLIRQTSVAPERRSAAIPVTDSLTANVKLKIAALPPSADAHVHALQNVPGIDPRADLAPEMAMGKGEQIAKKCSHTRRAASSSFPRIIGPQMMDHL
jgi:hypothetical protein